MRVLDASQIAFAFPDHATGVLILVALAGWSAFGASVFLRWRERSARTGVPVTSDDQPDRGDELEAHAWTVNALNEVISALADELNQPLAAMTNYVRGARALAARLELPDDDLLDAVELAGDQALRAGEIVRRMRTLASPGGGARQTERLGHLISETGAMIGPFVRANGVVVTYRLAGGPDLVLADRLRVQLLIVHLVRNAIEAARDSPRRLVVVSTTAGWPVWTVKVEDSRLGAEPHAANRGPAIQDIVKHSETDPGLAIPRAIAESHGGSLWVEKSRLGGAAFCFTLPSAAASRSDIVGLEDVGTHGLRD